MTLDSLVKGSRYTFDTLAPSVLGTTIKNAIYRGSLDYTMVTSVGTFGDVLTKFRTINPLLVNAASNKPENNNYYIFETENGDKIAFADTWINTATLTLSEEVLLKLQIPGFRNEDYNALVGLIQSLGYTTVIRVQ